MRFFEYGSTNLQCQEHLLFSFPVLVFITFYCFLHFNNLILPITSVPYVFDSVTTFAFDTL